MSADTDDEFQKELIALFVQEAQEWLQQIHVALDELQQGPPAERHIKLARTMKAGLTNLGVSAATIGLLEVEKVSFIGIPLVEAVENPSVPLSATAFLALCRQLGQIHDALTRATGVTFETEVAPVEVPSVTVPAQNLLVVLHELLGRLDGHAAAPCRVTKAIIAQIDGMTRNGVTHCDASSLRDVLERGAQAEQAFVQTVQQLGPLVAEGLGAVSRGSRGESDEMSGAWKAMVDRAGELWAASQQVNAVEAMTFFTGLQSFLAVVSAQRVVPDAAQFGKVETRLRGIPEVIHEWAEAGQRERQAIEALLPAAQG